MTEMDESKRLVQLANDRLRKGKVGVTLHLRGVTEDWLYLRGTFPPKPGSKKRQPHQQLVALKMRATRDAVRQAEAIAKVVGGELNLGTFSWAKWSDANPSEGKRVEDWVQEFEIKFWRGQDKNDFSKQNTWDKAYRLPFNRLPQKSELTIDVLIDWIVENTEPDSRRRQQYCTAGKGLATMAGLPTDVFRELAGGYGIKAVNPRSLPTDAAIVEQWRAIKDPGWRFLFGLQATYGLRNHECFLLDFDDFPIVRVAETAKTGARPVKPLYPEWVELFSLENVMYPAKMGPADGLGNSKLGEKLTQYFVRSLPDWKPYNLRHCYARRCLELGIAPDVAAKLMGHDLQMTLKIYRKWIGEKVYLDAVDRALDNPDRPSAPT